MFECMLNFIHALHQITRHFAVEKPKRQPHQFDEKIIDHRHVYPRSDL